MTLTYKEARDEILAVFKTAWDTTGYPVLYPDVAGDPPTTRTPWARVSIQHVGGNQAAIGGADGVKRYQRFGILTVVINTPSGQGLSEAYDLAKIVADAFEGASTSGGAWFREVTIQEAGVVGEWSQVNVLIDFTYDEIK